MLWRVTAEKKVYDLCKLINLPEGIIISHNFDQPVKYVAQLKLKQRCYEGISPLMNTNVNLVMNVFSKPLPLLQELWSQFTRNSIQGGFLFSVVPILYSISILAVVTWFLTVFVITNYTIKPSILLRVSVILSLAYMLITVAKSISVLHHQQKEGYLHGVALLDHLNELIYLNVIDMITVFLLQVNQVQVVMRLFLRQSDKRLIVLVGLGASIASQVLWAVTKFKRFHDDDEAGKIIPAFTYLIRIAMSISYAAMFTAFFLTKIKTLYAHKTIWLTSFLTIVFIFSPVAFFIADVSSTWAYELSEVFSVVAYMVCVVIPWEWCNKFNVIRKLQEKEGVLGRRFHEDEMYELDRFELFVEEESESDSDPDGNDLEREDEERGTSTAVESSLKSSSSQSKRGSDDITDSSDDYRTTAALQKLSYGYASAKNVFTKITDKIIATGLAIPRSVSAGSSYNVSQQAHLVENVLPVHYHEPVVDLDAPARDDLFVYSTKNVVVRFDE